MRTYVKTHPWLRFELDLSRMSPSFWMLLGEARSKCDHLAGVPLRPEVAKRMHTITLAKGVRATTAIEGNTLSEEDVLRQIEGTLELPRSKQYLAREVDNVVKAVNEIKEQCITRDGAHPLTVTEIKGMNRAVLDGLDVATDVRPGELREHSVLVAGYRGAPPQDCEYLLERLCTWLNDPQFEPTPEHGVAPAIVRAIISHLYLAWIHPFGDGNGRTARLLEFRILVSAGIPTPAAHLLSNHYNETRTDYYRQLDRASKANGGGGDVQGFLEYGTQGFTDQLREQIAVIRTQQLDVAWRNYVHEMFHDPSPADERQRHLVLDLSRDARRVVPRGELRTLTPRVAIHYEGKTAKTLSRDLNRLEELSLIERTSEGVRARVELVAAFLPARRGGVEAVGGGK